MAAKNGQIRGQSSSVAARIRGSRVTAGALARLTVDRLADQVGMAVVAGVLRDQVDDDPAQAEGALVGLTALLDRPTLEPRTGVGQGLVEDGVGPATGLVEQGEELLGRVVLGGVPLPVAVGVPVDGV